MNSYNDFGGQDENLELDEYIAREITDYYGQDVINSAKASAKPPNPKIRHKKIKKLYSSLSIVCAVAFLTGIMILSGIFINTGSSQPHSDNNSGSYFSSVAEPSDYSSASPPDSDISAESEIASSQNESTSSVKENQDTDSGASSQQFSSSGSDISSSVSNHTFSAEESANRAVENDSDSTSEYNMPEFTLSGSEAAEHIETDDTATRDHEYILPEIPDEGTVTSVISDPNNNSTTNPNDNVTTGRHIWAGVGIFLMIISLAISLVLNKLRAEY